MTYDLRSITSDEEKNNGSILLKSKKFGNIISSPPDANADDHLVQGDSGVEMTDFFRHVLQWTWPGSSASDAGSPTSLRKPQLRSWRSPVEATEQVDFATLSSGSGFRNTPSNSTFTGIGSSTMSHDGMTGSFSLNSDYGYSLSSIRNRSMYNPKKFVQTTKVYDQSPMKMNSPTHELMTLSKSMSKTHDVESENETVVETNPPPTVFYDTTSETSSDEEENSSDVRNAGNTSKSRMRKQKNGAAGDPFASREGRTLTWRNVNMTVKGKREELDKHILEEVWGEVPKRETTAIMGGSGAGKTSLLNILSGRVRTKGSLRITSDVRLNNYSVNPTNIKVRKSIAFVAQDDSLHSTTTPREAIRFSAKLRLPRSTTTEQIENLVTQMINALGLVSCADTIVGGPLIKGISGGERKRTSVGVELVVRPTMVFLDEPTSGLDSFSAIQVCQVLKKVANAGASVLFTIHQPSSDIFRSFDHLILLARGRVLYQGSVPDIPTYFEDRGYPLPPNFNPADWIINIAQQYDVQTLENAGFFEPDHRDSEDPSLARAGEDFIGRKNTKRQMLRSEKTASLSTQTYLLFTRELSHMYRYRLPVQTRMGVTAFLATLIGTIFWKVGDSDQTDFFNLQSHEGGVMVCLFFALLGAAQPALVYFPEERPIFLREYTTEHYSVTSYFLSRLLVEALLTGMQVFILIIVIFNMMAFKGRIVIFYAATYALAMAGTATAVWIGALAKGNVKSAQQLVPVILMPQLLFSGFFVSPSLMPAFLRWIQYICALTYAVKILMLEEFSNCSDNYFQQKNCDLVIENLQANPSDNLKYWLLLVGMFLGFRIMALFQLKRSATEFY